MIGEITDADIESPARAIAMRHALEVRVAGHLWRIAGDFLGDVRAMLSSGATPRLAELEAAWAQRVDDELGGIEATDEARALILVQALASSIPGEAYDRALDLLAFAATQGADRDAVLAAGIVEGFTPDEAPALTAAAARRFIRLDEQARMGDAFDDLVLGGSPTPGTPIEPPVWLPSRGDRWSTRVARDSRTIATRVQGALSLRRMRAAGRKNKRWVTRHDDRVRSSHEALDGVSVPIDQPFQAEGGALMFPGDRSAPIGEWINCRCVLTGLRGKRY